MVSLINISTTVHFALYKKRVLQYYHILFNSMRVTHLKVFFVAEIPENSYWYTKKTLSGDI